MEKRRALMVSLPRAQYRELEELGAWLECSKSQVIQQALQLLFSQFKEVREKAGVRSALDKA